MSGRPERETFADVVAQVKATPRAAPVVPPGRHRDTWGDDSGHRAYKLVTDELTPAAARALVAGGARLVYDQCGCGGAECRLDWVGDADAHRLAAAAPPRLHASHNGRADLEHWRSADGHDLVVAAAEVRFPDRLNGQAAVRTRGPGRGGSGSPTSGASRGAV